MYMYYTTMYTLIIYTSFLFITISNISLVSSSSCSVYTCPNVWDGQCGAFKKETSKWCDYDYDDEYDGRICCADDFSECCEDDPVAIGCTIGGAVAFLIFSFWYCRRRRDNTNDEEPNCCFKFFCPTCAVLSYQGCESKSDFCMSCLFGWFFTICCWQPKQVVVENTDNIECVNVSRDNNQKIINNF